MTDIVIEGGYAGGLLDTIVDFKFGQHQFAALTFQSTSDDINKRTDSLSVRIKQLGSSALSSPMMTEPKPYNNETTSNLSTVTYINVIYRFYVTYHHGTDSGTGGGTASTSSDGTHIFWGTNAGDGGVGGIDAVRAFFLASGWDTFEATQTDTFTSHTLGIKVYHDTNNHVYILNLTAIKQAVARLLKPKTPVPVLDVTFVTDVGGGPFDPNPALAGSLTWTATLRTYKKGSAKAFPVTPQCLPSNWPVATFTQVVTNEVGAPTPAKHVDFQINLSTLGIQSI